MASVVSPVVLTGFVVIIFTPEEQIVVVSASPAMPVVIVLILPQVLIIRMSALLAYGFVMVLARESKLEISVMETECAGVMFRT